MVNKMKIALALLSVAAALFVPSCSAEVVDRLDAVTSITIDEEATFIIEEVSSRRIEVRFSPVPYARSYAYEMSGEGFSIAQSLAFENGLNVISISGIDATSGTISLYASLDAGAKEGDGSWNLVGSAPFTLEPWRLAPDAYLSRRSTDSAFIQINSSTTSMTYGGELYDASGQHVDAISFSNKLAYEIKGLEPGSSYRIDLHHVDPASGELGNPCTIEIGVYDSAYEASMSIGVSAEGFVLEDIPSDISSVALYKATAAQGEAVELASANVESGRAIVPFASLKSLETGYFHFEGGGQRSNILKYTTSPRATSLTPSWKAVTIGVDFSDTFSSSDYSISLYGAANATLTMLEDGSGLRVSGLDSNTLYDGIGIQFLDEERGMRYILQVPSFTTKSFAGITYSWQGSLSPAKKTNYVVSVEPATEGSAFPYYVYFDKSDAVFTSNSYTLTRIMPVIDWSAGEERPTATDPVIVKSGLTEGGLNLTSQNAAYLLNSSKWNSMSVIPTSWYVVTADSNTSKDIVTTTTSSKAMNLNNTTVTTFSFCERVLSDGSVQPYVLFENLPGSRLVALGLYKNANPQTEFGSLDNPDYTWILTPVEEGQ